MQEQISALSAAVYALARPGNSPQDQGRVFRRASSAKELTFQGPTTSAFSFGLAKSSLQRRGIVDGDGDDAGEEGEEGDVTLPPTRDGTPVGMLKDPLWTISKAEAIRLCRVYEEEMGIMYPVLELEELLQQVEGLYGLSPRLPLRPGDDNVHILRLVFACALTAEASGRSELAMRLFESVRDVADDCVWSPPDIDRIILLTLVVSFFFSFSFFFFFFFSLFFFRYNGGMLMVRRFSTFKWTKRRWRGAPSGLSSACVWKRGCTGARRSTIRRL